MIMLLSMLLSVAILAKDSPSFRSCGAALMAPAGCRPPPVSVRHGQLLIMVNDITTLSTIFEQLEKKEHHTQECYDPVAALASASRVLMDAAAVVQRPAQPRSLWDVRFHLRQVLPAADVKFIDNVNEAFTLLRHVSLPELAARAEDIASRIRTLCNPDMAQVLPKFAKNPEAMRVGMHKQPIVGPIPHAARQRGLGATQPGLATCFGIGP